MLCGEQHNVYNDDGKLIGLPLNRALRDENGEMYDAVAGDFLVVGLGEEDFAFLTPEMAQKYEQLFHQPEAEHLPRCDRQARRRLSRHGDGHADGVAGGRGAHSAE